MVNITRGLLFLLCLFGGRGKNLLAQKSDTLLAMRDFISISNGYKQMPLYLELEMKNQTNFLIAGEDTSGTTGVFYLGYENAYVRFGEFEQMVNDSVALLISDKLKQMILYTNAAVIVKRMKNMMNVGVQDSSIQRLAAKYTASGRHLSKGSSAITLRSRAVIYGTNQPKETIELQYHADKKIPQRVTSTGRSLLRLDSLQYDQLKNKQVYAEKLISQEGNYFLVKEQSVIYTYKKIEHYAGVKIPALISDRVMRNESGDYLPVKQFEDRKSVV